MTAETNRAYEPVPVRYSCSRCSRQTDDPKRDGWFTHLIPVVVQGVTLGLCRHCAAGTTPDADNRDWEPCGGKCKGDYRPAVGTYFEATQHRLNGAESWACWDEACVEMWADEHSECEECGHDFDVDVHEHCNGKRVFR
jgi:hypothetical protein